MSKLKVYTAVDSMLYSPVFLALVMDETLGRNVELIPVANEVRTVDWWLHDVIHLHDWAVGIGDPMRLTAFANPRKVDFLGILIDKMCFWIVDHDFDGEWFNIDRFVVHPRGMTAFSVAAHQLAERWQLNPLSDDQDERNLAIRKLNERLHDDGVDPNNEMQAYLDVRNRIGRRESPQGVRHAAFITANPLYGKTASPDLRNLYSFMTDYPKAIMTTLIGRANPHDEERALRAQLVSAVALACMKIQEAPISCAEMLWEGWSRIHPSGRLTPSGFAKRSEFASALRSLAGNKVYNLDPKLFVSWKFLENTCEIRRCIEPLLPKEQRQSSVKAVADRLKDCVHDA